MAEDQEKELRVKAIQAAINYYEFRHKDIKTFKPGDRIPYASRVFDEKEIAALVDASLDFWLTAGRYAKKFEQDFAKFLNVKHCSLTNSGSSANLLAFMALTAPPIGERRIKKGDEVITVAVSFPTMVAPIIQYGAVPVFVDVVLPNYNIDCSQLEIALSDKTKAVMLTHTLGNPFDLKSVKAFCDRHDLWLIEDNCDSLGSRYRRLDDLKLTGVADPLNVQPANPEYQYTGTFGHIGTSSFYASHHMTMGEGGAVYTNDSQLKRIVESLRDWGTDCWCNPGHDDTCKKRFTQQFGRLPRGYDHKYVYSHFGYNLKITDMQAAIGCAQLAKLPGFIETRKINWKMLRDGLADLADKFILPEPTENSDPSWFAFLLTVKKNAGFKRDDIVNYLEQNGIQTRMLFSGNILNQPCFDELQKMGEGYRVVGELKNTDIAMEQAFWFGVYPGLTEDVIRFIFEKINLFVREDYLNINHSRF